MGDLYDAAKGSPSNLALTVEIDDADAVHDYLASVGIRIARGLENTSWDHRSFGIDDSDGLRIWFHQVLSVEG